MNIEVDVGGNGWCGVIFWVILIISIIFGVYSCISDYQIDGSNQTTIRHVQVIGEYIKQDPRDNSDNPSQFYFCDLAYIDHGQQKVEPFKDVDQGDKVNSSDIYATCMKYDTHNSGSPYAGKFLDAQVIGVRDPSQSRFRNILKLTPSQ
jgi:hypothetical protein